MAEFAINSSVNDSMGFAPFELTYGAMPCMFHKIEITPFLGVKSFAEKALTNLAIVHNLIIANHMFKHTMRTDTVLQRSRLKEGDLVYLSTKNLNLLKHQGARN
jgi:exosortase/archaeosortase